MRFVSRPIPALDDPLSRDPDLVWMSPGVSLWGWGEAGRIHPGSGDDRIAVLAESFSRMVGEASIDDEVQVSGSGPVAFGSIAFASGSAGSVGVVPRVVVGRHLDRWWLTTADGADLPPPTDDPNHSTDRARYAGSSVPDVLWLEAVAKAIVEIESGALEKVVLARDYAVWSRKPFHPARLLRHLHDRFPSCYVFRVADLIGASPELLVRRHSDRMESLVLAGSAATYADPEADRAAAEALLGSTKDLWEHELVVRSVRETLAEITDEAEISDRPHVYRLDNVQHLATRVRARVPTDRDALSLVEALHPTPAVGGRPSATALDLIQRLEGMDRARYAGPVGWIDGRGDGEYAIALRCAELSGARARLFAGAGIVTGSLPEAELEETRLKLSAMMGALAAS